MNLGKNPFWSSDKSLEGKFRAFQVEELQDGTFKRSLVEKNLVELPEHEVLIRVHWSGLNYKDALSASGNKGVTRHYPHTPGIDAAGLIVSSTNKEFKAGEPVIVTSYDLGMNTSGGFGEFISVPSSWIVPLPSGLSLRESMMLGTAGLTAAQAIFGLINSGQKPEDGKILVTGARGAVGTQALQILSQLGFELIAGVSELGDDTALLKELGAYEVIDKSITNDASGRLLQKPLWAGAIDTIGGNTLATILKSTSYGGNVVCVGNVESHLLNTSVFPFILNGVSLIGVATADTPMELRQRLWLLMGNEWKPNKLDLITTEIQLEQLDQYLMRMIQKKSRGRILLQHQN